jgi:hypothetical protein
MVMRSALALISASAFLIAQGCAAQNSEHLLTPQQTAMIKATCQQVMHIGYHNGVDLDACMGALAESLAAKTQGDIVWKSDADCAAQGLKRDTPAFSMCVLDRQNGYVAGVSRSNAATDGAPSAPTALAYDAGKDNSQAYYDASFDTKRRREQYSCAQLGIDPISSAFGQCVADLDADLFNADHPNP